MTDIELLIDELESDKYDINESIKKVMKRAGTQHFKDWQDVKDLKRLVDRLISVFTAIEYIENIG